MIVSPSCGQPLYIQRALGLGFSWAHAYGPLEPQTLLGSHLKNPSHVHGRCPERRSSSARCQGLDVSWKSMQNYMLVGTWTPCCWTPGVRRRCYRCVEGTGAGLRILHFWCGSCHLFSTALYLIGDFKCKFDSNPILLRPNEYKNTKKVSAFFAFPPAA